MHPVSKSLLPLMLTIAVTASATAQDRVLDDPTTGVREPATIPDVGARGLGLLGVVPPRKYQVVLSPGFTATNTTNVYGATLGIVRGQLTHPFQIKATYRRLDAIPAASTDRDRFVGNGKVLIFKDRPVFPTRLTTMSVIGNYSRTFEVSSRWDGTLAVDQSLNKLFALGANVSYASLERDAGRTTRDVILAGGLKYVGNPGTDVSADYSTDNDVDGEDGFTVTLAQLVSPARFPATKIIVVGGKHRVISTSLSVTF